MGRIFREIRVNGARRWALFDSGSANTYVTKSSRRGLPKQRLKPPRLSRLGGREHTIREEVLLSGVVEGYRISANGFVTDEIGTDEKGRPIEVLVGALCMQQWGIVLDLKNERLDFTHYPKEFVEFGS